MPFIDLTTLKPLQLVLPVTVLFVALMGLANFTCMAGRMAPGTLRSRQVYKNRIRNALLWHSGGALLPLLYGKLAVAFSHRRHTGYVSLATRNNVLCHL